MKVMATMIWCVLLVAASARAAEPKAGDRFRIDDDRPQLTINAKQLKDLGITIFESKRLRLFTDLDAEVAKTLPSLVDQAFESWEDYFGKLPPARDGSEFQINGFLMKNKMPFEKAGLLRDDLPDQFHGRQSGYQFWMMDQTTDYYRRHLLLHEATHAFMLAIARLEVPYAYLEGMAEHFGTHQIIDGKLQMRLMPSNRADFRGHDRLISIRREIPLRGSPKLFDIHDWKPANFQFFNESYAWAWAWCLFLDQNPRTHDRFRKLAKSLADPTAWKTFESELEPDLPEIRSEWNLFVGDAWEGFDFVKSAIEFHEGQPLKGSAKHELQADRGWQSSRVLVEKGRRYEIVATGQVTLANRPKPWVSEADGITIRYHNGRPLGQLLATVRPPNSDGNEAREPMLEVKLLGNKTVFEPSRSGTLYLRLNDHPAELADNRGALAIEVREAE